MTTAPAAPDLTAGPRPKGAHLGFAMLALTMGGFTIGTTEFVTMGLLPEIADGVAPRSGRQRPWAC